MSTRGTKRRHRTIIVKRENGIAWLILNRPERLNALTMELFRELSSALDEIIRDDSVRTLVIMGAGDRAFSAGVDVTTFVGMDSASALGFSQKTHAVLDKIEKYPKPIIAAINGYALGGGCELALACDFRIATEKSELGQPEIKLGIIPGGGATQRMTRIVGLARAKELIMLGDRISANKAEKIGLVNKVVPNGKLVEETKVFARRLGEGPPLALRLAKQTLGLDRRASLDDGLKFESRAFAEAMGTEDAKRGIKAFLSKKRPQFVGK
ncbi:MAG: enoyl-CoA hydratase/isomerase family protein [Candidatus Bathyarchaeia archaeon]